MSKHFHPKLKPQIEKRKLFWSYFIPKRRGEDSLLVAFLSLLGGGRVGEGCRWLGSLGRPIFRAERETWQKLAEKALRNHVFRSPPTG